MTNKSNIGLIPVENSVAGRVAEIHSLMHKTSLKIVGEYFMKVELHLLGIKTAKISQINNVKSHIYRDLIYDIPEKKEHNIMELINPRLMKV